MPSDHAKRLLRGFIKAAAMLAGLVLIFDNGVSERAGMMLLGSFAVLCICVLVWLKFDLGDDWFSRKKPNQ